MKLVIVALFCLVSLALSQTDDEWANYKAKYNKFYRSGDDLMRKEIWQQNLRLINSHNAEAAKGKFSYFLGENQFADLTFDEFKQQYLGLKMPLETAPAQYHYASGKRKDDFVDLRARGLVSSVKNQGSCGSCWAFSSIVALEGAWANAGNPLVELSEQQMVDCATKTPGCNGGWMNPTFEYIRDNGGIQSRSSYPYTATNGTCKQNAAHNVAFIKGPVAFKNIPLRDHGALQDAIEGGNPVSVAVYVENTFQLYKSGIYDRAISLFESLFSLNHAITIVGYDFTGSTPYYVAKNSWDTTWGESGYMRLHGNKDTAGILQKGSFPVV